MICRFADGECQRDFRYTPAHAAWRYFEMFIFSFKPGTPNFIKFMASVVLPRLITSLRMFYRHATSIFRSMTPIFCFLDAVYVVKTV